MKRRRSVASFSTLVMVVFLVSVFWSIAQAGKIETIPIEDKGVLEPMPGIITFPSKVQVNLGGLGGPTVTIRWNAEIVSVTAVGPAVRVFNVYPDTMHVPQTPAFDPDEPIDFFFFMAVDPDTTSTTPVSGLGPLPSDWTLVEASMTGSSGTQFSAVITPISNLATLPTSSTYLTDIHWDLSAFSQTTGNFYLAKVTFPNAGELFPSDIPALSEWGMILFVVLLAGTAVVAIRRIRRKVA